MGWERRGKHEYYYRKEREGSQVKSVYVGRGEIAQMVSEIQSTTPLIERLARVTKTTKDIESQKREAILDEAIVLIQQMTEATFLTAGFHTHHRQWRRIRNAESN
jgi:hypothetical protein